MSLDPVLASIPEGARELLARIGRRFGSREVQAQARQTLIALGRFAAELRLHGFGDADARLLAGARAEAALRTRVRAKVTDRDYVVGLGEAKTSRARARSVLSSAYRRLRASGGPGAETSMEVLAAILAETSEPGGDDRVYATQIEHLLEVLARPGISEAVVDSGGPEAVNKLTRALVALRNLDEPTPTLEDLESDILDGLMMELARTAQFAAQSAAREVGNRAIASEFRLSKLMKSPEQEPEGDG